MASCDFASVVGYFLLMMFDKKKKEQILANSVMSSF